MKKTLITLAALAAASVAIAATPTPTEDVTNPGSNVNTTDSTSFTMIAVMDWDTLYAALPRSEYWGGSKNDFGYMYAVNGANTQVAKGFALIKDTDSGNICSFISEWKGAYTYVNATGTITSNSLTLSNDKATLVFDKAGYANDGELALSLSYDSSTRSFTLGALKSDGKTMGAITLQMAEGWFGSMSQTYTAADLEGSLNGKVEQFQWYDSALGTTDLAAVTAALVAPVTPPGGGEGGAIPEPATATLSLLALAGLAARRRRK